MDVILIRHGRTTLNKQNVFRGRLDVDLDETSNKQAELLAKSLEAEHIDAVLSSPLKRAVQTAECIARSRDIKTMAIDDLNDMDLGIWQGMPKKEVEGKFPGLWKIWISLIFSLPPRIFPRMDLK